MNDCVCKNNSKLAALHSNSLPACSGCPLHLLCEEMLNQTVAVDCDEVLCEFVRLSCWSTLSPFSAQVAPLVDFYNRINAETTNTLPTGRKPIVQFDEFHSYHFSGSTLQLRFIHTHSHLKMFGLDRQKRLQMLLINFLKAQSSEILGS